MWAHLGPRRPVKASGGQTKQTTVEMKVVYGILEQVGSVQRGQKRSITHIPKTLIGAHLGLLGPLEASGGQTKQW